ncbi:MAG: phosphatidate cytidylyltransferase [Lachnospiraceae bacterium]|nr:phosphatidate cytidylyltransferase [Lachnospiraceae bacterium]
MFWVRTRSAAVIVIVALLSLIYGGNVLFGVLLVISMIGMMEILRVVEVNKTSLGAMGYLITAVWFGIMYFDLCDKYALHVIIAYLMLIMCLYVFSFPKYTSEQITMAFFGLTYVVIMLSFIYRIRMLDNGLWLVWLVFMGSWISDTCAYCTGMLIGKHKLSPKVSPKKSIEGSLGGIIGAALLGGLYAYFVRDKISMSINPVVAFAIISGASSIISQLGDLAASAIKRNKGIKDYGTLIPGHGGILDRFDSVIFTAPIVYFLAVSFMK